MDWTAWTAIAAVLGAFGLAGGWIFRLSTRLSQADAKADSAAKDATAAAVQAAALRGIIEVSEEKMRASIAKTESELVEHRVYVAREYVSNATILSLEEKLIKAIDRLGDRLDQLFTARVQP